MTAANDTPARLDRRLSVAPMMDCTDRHFRYLARLLTRRTLLYTEMVAAGAVLHGDRARHLGFDAAEHPVALQLGGSDPTEMAACARIAAEWGYDEVNLNVGCPSDRVQSGAFGACLMARPDTVAACVRAMRDAADLPVTVKTRIGIDDKDSYAFLTDFVGRVAEAGCGTLIVHARKAWLHGLSPKENREIPPLNHPRVHRLAHDFPHLEVVINGGVRTLDGAVDHLRHVDGVMIGRAAYDDPCMLAAADRRLWGDAHAPASRHAVLDAYADYAARQVAVGVPLRVLARHAMGLFAGLPGARKWRRYLSENAGRAGAGAEVLREAAAFVPADAAQAA